MALKEMHPLLPASTAIEYGHRAALGLERHGHRPGALLHVTFSEQARDAQLEWARPAPGSADLLDHHRVTEDAAEAIALALVHTAEGWVVRRRLQRGDFADWLLADAESELVALEVSGVDHDGAESRLRAKLEQVRHATIGRKRVACVVELASPRATCEFASPEIAP